MTPAGTGVVKKGFDSGTTSYSRIQEYYISYCVLVRSLESECSQQEVAHFFWHGDLSRLEIACIKSFVAHGFDVNLWSYTGLKVDGAKSRNAAKILPIRYLTLVSQHSEFTKTTRGADHGALAAFSDLFRYKVLADKGGWWFDTDCMCLWDSYRFTEMRGRNEVFACEEYANLDYRVVYVGGIYLKPRIAGMLLEEAIALCRQSDYSISWGSIGPILMGKFVESQNLWHCILPPDPIYAFSHADTVKLIYPDLINEAFDMIDDAPFVHLFDSALVLGHGVDKNQPPAGSALEALIKMTE